MTGVHSLDRIVEAAPDVQGIWARDVAPGDWVVVRTKNSVYSLTALGDGRFAVSGGWFAQHAPSTPPVRVIGCTWGRRAILTGLVAAPGMCVEFENGVCTTRVRDVQLIRRGEQTVH